jgi:hypothetical protein
MCAGKVGHESWKTCIDCANSAKNNNKWILITLWRPQVEAGFLYIMSRVAM